MTSSQANTIRTVTPAELFAIHSGGKAVELIDVRTPAEYREVHATLARLVPLDSLDPKRVVETRSLPGEPMYVICRTGGRGKKACEAFAAAGLGHVVVNVEGGTLAWEQAGLPVERGKKTISLERQFRIAVGSLVVLATALGAFVSPWFLLLSGFCGAGLVNAGITDVCPLAMILAKLPWNQVSTSETSCSA